MSRLGYVPSLDGLRGAGIAVVIGAHYFGYPRGGYFSMDMFFALSGFLITTLLLEERDPRASTQRVLRPAPRTDYCLPLHLAGCVRDPNRPYTGLA